MLVVDGYVDVPAVVLLAEDVDRNAKCANVRDNIDMSSSSRRTWIEIESPGLSRKTKCSRPPRGGRG